MHRKFIIALLMNLTFATACMDNQKPSFLKRVQALAQRIPDAIRKGTVGFKLYSCRSPEIIEPLLQRLELKKHPAVYCPLYANWATMLIERKHEDPLLTEYDFKNTLLLIRRGADLFSIIDTYRAPLLTIATQFNNAPVVLAILAHVQQYSHEELALAEQRIQTLLCCLKRNNIHFCRDVRNLLINSCIATLLEPQPNHIARLKKILAQKDLNSHSLRAYDYVKDRTAEITYDAELLNPDAAIEQSRQTYLANCARFKKNIFKKDE